MGKKLLSCIITLCMLLMIIPSVMAADTSSRETAEYIPDAQTAAVSVSTGSDDADNDELFAAYLHQLMYGDQEAVTFGTRARDRLKVQKEIDLYNDLKAKIIAVANGDATSTEFEISSERNYDTEYKWEKLNLENPNDDALRTSVRRVVECLLADCPAEFYWFDKTEGFTPFSSSWSGDEYHYLRSINFTVSEAYRAGGNEYAVDPSIIKTARTAISSAEKIVKKYESKSDLEKLTAYFEEICDLVSYNTSVDDNTPYGDPWQIVWVFDGDESTNITCEGYAKAFQYLCDLTTFDNDIKCYTVTGIMKGVRNAGAHMWNIVTMEDGLNYLVDITNCDENSVGAPDKLFLAGTSHGSYDDWYIFDNVSGISYLYDDGSDPHMPDMITLYGEGILTLAGTNYTPKSLYSIEVTQSGITYGDPLPAPSLPPEAAGGVEVTTTYEGRGSTVYAAAGTKPVNAGDYKVTVRYETDGVIYSGSADFTIAKRAISSESVMLDGVELTVDAGSSHPKSIKDAKANGAPGETVTGTLAWYTDEGCTKPANGKFDTAGSVTLYWSFSPAATETNYAAEPTTGSAVFTVQGAAQDSYTINNVSVDPSSGTVKVEIGNYNGEISSKLAVAAYDTNGRFIGIAVKELEGATATLNMNLDDDVAGISAFIFDDQNRPLSENKSIVR